MGFLANVAGPLGNFTSNSSTPVIGNTVTYGMDPYAFFFANQKKVCRTCNGRIEHN